jgi:hypothetical protein
MLCRSRCLAFSFEPVALPCLPFAMSPATVQSLLSQLLAALHDVVDLSEIWVLLP